ncbi:MAG: hypothetical protein S4CHLAM2_13400 [Chlamydiales bacterium]|nr:hypothetical protein [Chlamydiales bacterium]
MSTDGIGSNTSMVVYNAAQTVSTAAAATAHGLQPSGGGGASAGSSVRPYTREESTVPRVLAYIGGTVLVLGGVGICAVPLPATSAIGIPVALSGVGVIAYAENRIRDMQLERLEAANDDYEYLNRVHLAALAVFNNQISVLAQNIEAFENQVGEMHNQNAAHAANNRGLRAEIDRLIGEGQQNRETVLKLQTVTRQLNQTSTQFLTGITENKRNQVIDQAAVQAQLDQLTGLVGRLEGESTRPLAELAEQFQGTVQHVLTIASIEQRLRDTQADLHRTEGRLDQLNKQYDQLNAQNQATADQLQAQVERLTGEISKLEREREHLVKGRGDD